MTNLKFIIAVLSTRTLNAILSELDKQQTWSRASVASEECARAAAHISRELNKRKPFIERFDTVTSFPFPAVTKEKSK